jgi:endonuclease/exonuclease/phosphatase family metal-dependent hydrolase
VSSATPWRAIHCAVQIPSERRQAILEGARDRAAHARWLAELALDTALDVGGAPSPGDPPRDALRVVAWNLERCRQLEASAERLASLAPDVLLLSELDWGMARSGNRHTARELAARLGFAYAFGVEFLELELGGPAERAELAGRTNELGLHGNALLVRGELLRPRLLRLERRGDWFDGARGERRVGGRCAVLGQVRLAGRLVSCASLHLESHGSREQRAEELQTLLDALDDYDRDAPALIGGDLNSFSLALAELTRPDAVAAALRADPQRWSNPVPHEPLFERAARAGFAWADANAAGVATLRHASPASLGGSTRGALKLDWLLCRGLAASAPRVIEALSADGRMLSDHELVAAELRLAAG